MSLQREDAANFSDLDAETRIRLLLEYISVLRGGIRDNGKLLENTDVNATFKKVYDRLEKEFEK